jgi:cysteine synthase A
MNGHGKVYDDITLTIGNTPMVRINRLVPPEHGTVLAKCEFFNPLSSVKDRIGPAMIEAAERDGLIDAETEIVEPTSGNMGVALAFICAARRRKLTLTMPESMSIERRILLLAMGAKVRLTPDSAGMRGAVEAAEEIVAASGNAWMPQQFENPANPDTHEKTTAVEIWNDTGGQVDAVVAGVGTGGTITGIARYFKRRNSDFKVIAVEPANSQVLSGGSPGGHQIQGIGAGFVPKVLDTSLIDEVMAVADEEAFDWARRLAHTEGLMVGISSGANLSAAARLAERKEYRGKRIVTLMCSGGERYLSTSLFTAIAKHFSNGHHFGQ